MRVSSKTEYAMKTAVDLALHYGEGLCTSAEIAARQNIPLKFLGQILLVLKGGGIVLSKRGVSGGYVLAKRPSEISLAEIARLTGAAALMKSESRGGKEQNSCGIALEEVWADIREYASRTLEEASLQDMCERREHLASGGGSNYSI